MSKVIVRYKVKPECAQENTQLVNAVFSELKEMNPPRLRYAAFVAADGVTFFHVVSIEGDANPLFDTAAFKAFQKDIADRCDEIPGPTQAEILNLEAWLIKTAHNKAIDHLRDAQRSPIDFVDEYPPIPYETPPLEAEEVTAFALSIYLQLTPLQRSSVILKDVVGYSLAEVSEILDVSVGAIKAALHRGRDNLRSLAETTDDISPLDTKDVRKLLSAYVERFNSRDFDGVRAMLADDVRLDLVERLKTQGASEVRRYFGNYDKLDNWRLNVGYVERKLAILVSEMNQSSQLAYFISLRWKDGQVISIRDYRYARIVMEDAQVRTSVDTG
jgi:RNA polymerase sigma-70 factor, ECF subfamily